MPRITIIYTDDTKPRRYVSATTQRTNMIDNNMVVLLTTDPDNAHDFGSTTEAKKVIPIIHNPFDRTYLVTTIESKNKPAARILAGEIE